MGIEEKLDAKVDQTTGRIKAEFGDLTDDEELQAEGRSNTVKGDLREGWEDTKDAAGSGWEKVKDAGRDATG